MNLFNMTTSTSNYTDVGDIVGDLSLEDADDDVPLVVAMDGSGEEGHGELGFFENSMLKIIPKFFKAMVTLLICGLLLGTTFLLINMWKRGCRTHRKLVEEGKSKNGKAGGHHHSPALHSVIVTPPDDEEDDDPTQYIDYDETTASSSIQPIRPSYAGSAGKYMQVPKKAMLRRASGPFGSEALSFVGEQYSMKTIEKERHHYVPGHGRHSPHSHQHQHFHSGHSSTGGGSNHGDDDGKSKSKIKNLFKGNK